MKITEDDIKELKEKAKCIRQDILEEVYSAQSGHPGGALSIVEILTVLYFNQMNIDPKNPKNEMRDRLVLSKGHCCAALYATLAERGYFDKEKLMSFRKLESNLQGHPDLNKVPGVDMVMWLDDEADVLCNLKSLTPENRAKVIGYIEALKK